MRRALLALAVATAALAAVPASAVITPGKGPPRPGAPCTATLVVAATRGAEGCWLDEQVTRQPGTLRYPCGGGPAEARFGGVAFRGRVETDGRVALVLGTRFHYADGCDWGTEQHIDGRLPDGRLSYDYREFPLPGQTDCARPCHAVAEVAVRR